MENRREQIGRLDYEVGDVIFWVAFGQDKPFPVFLYRERDIWKFKHHAQRNLNENEEKDLAEFAAQRLLELQSVWRGHLNTRLHWTIPKNKKKKRKR